MPVFHLLAAPNGAGKSTLYAALVRDGILGANLAFINADLFEREHLQHIIDLCAAFPGRQRLGRRATRERTCGRRIVRQRDGFFYTSPSWH